MNAAEQNFLTLNFSCGTVYDTVQDGFNFCVCG